MHLAKIAWILSCALSEYMVTDVCSLYICRSDNSLELYATHGLNKDAVRTTLRIGEGVIGHIAAKDPILTNAPAHKYFPINQRPMKIFSKPWPVFLFYVMARLLAF